MSLIFMEARYSSFNFLSSTLFFSTCFFASHKISSFSFRSKISAVEKKKIIRSFKIKANKRLTPSVFIHWRKMVTFWYEKKKKKISLFYTSVDPNDINLVITVEKIRNLARKKSTPSQALYLLIEGCSHKEKRELYTYLLEQPWKNVLLSPYTIYRYIFIDFLGGDIHFFIFLKLLYRLFFPPAGMNHEVRFFIKERIKKWFFSKDFLDIKITTDCIKNSWVCFIKKGKKYNYKYKYQKNNNKDLKTTDLYWKKVTHFAGLKKNKINIVESKKIVMSKTLHSISLDYPLSVKCKKFLIKSIPKPIDDEKLQQIVAIWLQNDFFQQNGSIQIRKGTLYGLKMNKNIYARGGIEAEENDFCNILLQVGYKNGYSILHLLKAKREISFASWLSTLTIYNKKQIFSLCYKNPIFFLPLLEKPFFLQTKASWNFQKRNCIPILELQIGNSNPNTKHHHISFISYCSNNLSSHRISYGIIYHYNRTLLFSLIQEGFSSSVKISGNNINHNNQKFFIPSIQYGISYHKKIGKNWLLTGKLRTRFLYTSQKDVVQNLKTRGWIFKQEKIEEKNAILLTFPLCIRGIHTEQDLYKNDLLKPPYLLMADGRILLSYLLVQWKNQTLHGSFFIDGASYIPNKIALSYGIQLTYYLPVIELPLSIGYATPLIRKKKPLFFLKLDITSLLFNE